MTTIQGLSLRKNAAWIPLSEGARSEVARLVIWRDFSQCPYVAKAGLELVLCQPFHPPYGPDIVGHRRQGGIEIHVVI